MSPLPATEFPKKTRKSTKLDAFHGFLVPRCGRQIPRPSKATLDPDNGNQIIKLPINQLAQSVISWIRLPSRTAILFPSGDHHTSGQYLLFGPIGSSRSTSP